jgi:NhaA family Na+:H+ antiporter
MNDRTVVDDLPRAQRLAEQALETLQRFLHVEAASRAVLVFAAAVAVMLADSPFAHGYHAFWNLRITIGLGEYVFSKPLHFWVNDGL